MIPPADWVVVPVGALRERAATLEVEQQRDGASVATPVTLMRRSETEAVITGVAAGSLVAAQAARVRELGP